MARYLLDTNIFTFLATDEGNRISRDVRTILQNYENEFLMGMEYVRELIVAYRVSLYLSRRHISAYIPSFVCSLSKDGTTCQKR